MKCIWQEKFYHNIFQSGSISFSCFWSAGEVKKLINVICEDLRRCARFGTIYIILKNVKNTPEGVKSEIVSFPWMNGEI